MTERRRFGQVRRLRSGRWQARWMLSGVWYTARRDSDGGPWTFNTEQQAKDHLTWIKKEIDAGRWQPPRPEPRQSAPTLRTYAEAWLAERDLQPTTRDHYRMLLEQHIYPAFGDRALTAIAPAAVRTWHASLARASGKRVKDRPTVRAHAYALLRTICNTAVSEDVIVANPCRIRGAGQVKRAKQIRPASLAELEALVTAMPARYRLMALLASWCGLRFGELAELRRSDVKLVKEDRSPHTDSDLGHGVLHVRRGVVRTSDGRLVKSPKSEAGVRDVAIPPHLIPAVRDHLRDHAEPGRDGLLFPAKGGGHMAPSSLYRVFYPARDAAQRPDLRFHDLIHTGAVLAASTGAGLADLMARLGHSTPQAAMRYQHAATEADRRIAEGLSKLAAGNVVPIGTAKRKRGKEAVNE